MLRHHYLSNNTCTLYQYPACRSSTSRPCNTLTTISFLSPHWHAPTHAQRTWPLQQTAQAHATPHLHCDRYLFLFFILRHHCLPNNTCTLHRYLRRSSSPCNTTLLTRNSSFHQAPLHLTNPSPTISLLPTHPQPSLSQPIATNHLSIPTHPTTITPHHSSCLPAAHLHDPYITPQSHSCQQPSLPFPITVDSTE